MSQLFPVEEPATEVQPAAAGQWRLFARDHARKEFGTPPGGLKFATLIEAMTHAEGQWLTGCSVWVLNDNDGEIHARQPNMAWYCTRRGNVKTWMAGKTPVRGLGSGRVEGRRR